MNYLFWALLAMSAYAFVAPLTKLAFEDIPMTVVFFVTNTILVIIAAGIVLIDRGVAVEYLTHPRAPYMYAAGLFLTLGIASYYRALATGPVSVVVPIFGLFIALSSAIGIIALDEPATVRKGVGIILAVVAIYLTSVE